MKKQIFTLLLSFILFLGIASSSFAVNPSISPTAVSPSIITNRSDGTFLIDGQPFFPIAFWPLGLEWFFTNDDFVEWAANGINLAVLNDPNLMAQARNAGLKILYPTVTGSEAATIPNASSTQIDDLAAGVVNTAKPYEASLFAYYGADEPILNYSYEQIHGTLGQNFFRYLSKINSLDPNHPIWTNNQLPAGFPPETEDLANYWDTNTKTSVISMDFYLFDPTGISYWTEEANKLKNVYPGVGKGGTLMFINASDTFRFGLPTPYVPTYQERLQMAFQAIASGINGLVLYTEVNGSESAPGCPVWQSACTWQWFKSQPAYQDVKVLAALLRSLTPGLVGTTVTGPSTINSSGNPPCGKVLTKLGTDGKFYIFLVNRSEGDQNNCQVIGIPSQYDGTYKELMTNGSFVISGGKLNFSNPYKGVRIFVQETPAKQSLSATPSPSGSNLNCFRKKEGDANCDGEVNNNDYLIWDCEFKGDGQCQNQAPSLSADFNADNKLSLIDYEIWRRTFYH